MKKSNVELEIVRIELESVGYSKKEIASFIRRAEKKHKKTGEPMEEIIEYEMAQAISGNI